MQAVVDSVRGLSVALRLNWDSVFVVGTIIVGLLAGAFLGQALMLAVPPGGG